MAEFSEEQIQQNEEERILNEAKRVSDEVERVQGEENRIENERERISKEAERETNEIQRMAREDIRQGFYDGFNDRLNEVNSQLAHITNKIDITPEDFGAKGDGVTDDYQAFKEMAEYCNKKGSNVKITLNGVYYFAKIGEYSGRDNIIFKEITGLEIQGNGSKIIANGNYDAVKHWSVGDFKYSDFHSIAIYFIGCSYLSLNNFEINGGGDNTLNTQNTIATNNANGMHIASCDNVVVDNIVVEKYNCDSFIVGERFDTESKIPSTNVFVKNCRFSYGARNSVTIGLVQNVTFESCEISYGGFSGGGMGSHSPGVGLDIEPDYSIDGLYSNITFSNCIFQENKQGVLTVSGTGVNGVKFVKNTFLDIPGNSNLFSISITQDNVVFDNNYIVCYSPISVITNYPSLVKRITLKNNIIDSYNTSAFLLASNHVNDKYATINIQNNRINCYNNASEYPLYIQAPIYFINNEVYLYNCTQVTCLLQQCKNVSNNSFLSDGENVSLSTTYTSYVENNYRNNILQFNNPTFNSIEINSITKGMWGDNSVGKIFFYNSYHTNSTNTFINKVISNNTVLFNVNKQVGEPALIICTSTGYFDNNNPWKPQTSYSVNTYVNSNKKIYCCVTAGESATTGPTGTDSSIVDGTVIWKYVGNVMSYKTLLTY